MRKLWVKLKSFLFLGCKQRILITPLLSLYHGQRKSDLACARVIYKDTFIREQRYVKIFIQQKAVNDDGLWAYIKYKNAISVWKTIEIGYKRLILSYEKWSKIKLCLHHNNLHNHLSPTFSPSAPLLVPVAEIANISSLISVHLHHYTPDDFFRNLIAGSTICCL